MGVFDGKVAIVTGAGGGIGRGIVAELAKEGASISICEWNKSSCDEAAAELRDAGHRAIGTHCDVSQRDQVDAAVAETVAAFGTVDILINNAQTTRTLPLEKTTDKDVALMMGTGLRGTIYFMQACFPHMKQNGGGKIINFGSGAGVVYKEGFAAFAANKEAIRAVSRVAGQEWGEHNINVNVICPFSRTPALEKLFEMQPEVEAPMEASSAMNRIGDPARDIGRTAVFLAGPDSDYLTCQTLMVDGGAVILR